MKPIFKGIGVAACMLLSINALANTDMYAEMKASIESISKKYGNPKFTFIISSDPAVQANQIELVHLAKINGTIAEKTADLESVEVAILERQAWLESINFSVSNIKKELETLTTKIN